MAKRFPIVICLYNDIISGVTSWAFRLKKAFENNPHYEILLLNWVGPNGPKAKYDFNVTGLNEVREIFASRAPAVVVPNYIWQIYQGVNVSGIKYIGFCHSDTKEEYYGPLCENDSHIAKFIAVSPTCQKTLGVVLPHRLKDITLLPYGVPVPNQLNRLYQTEPIRLIYGGRVIQEQKRVFDFVPLVQNLLKKKIDFIFDIVGEGPDLDELKNRLEREAPTERVKFLGRREPEEMAYLWRQYDIFLQVSAFEGTSVSMLEAMAQGTIPVVTAASSGVSNVISHGKNGLITPIGDMEALAYSISYLASKPSKQTKMGRKVHQNAKRYSIQAYVASFEQLLDQATGKSLELSNHLDKHQATDLSTNLKRLATNIDLPKPTISYMICTTPRSGSNWLCGMLNSSNLAGFSNEYLYFHDLENRIKHFLPSELSDRFDQDTVRNFGLYFQEISRSARTDNGVLGIKVMAPHFYDFIGKAKQHIPKFQGTNYSSSQITENLFPNMKYIWLTRRNKIRQAVSYLMARQTDVWYAKNDHDKLSNVQSFYDGHSLTIILQMLARQDALWQEYFKESGVEPLVLVYEDIVQDSNETIYEIFDYLDVEISKDGPIQFVSPSERIANADSETWYRRYLEECSQVEITWSQELDEQKALTKKAIVDKNSDSK